MAKEESISTSPDIFLCVSKIRDLISQNKDMRKHFRHELQFLEKREKVWREQRFRIGLLGITSSGKSTLVNALLQEKLLPEAVRPSSNSLVVCQWGQQPEGKVFFSDASRTPAIFKGKHIYEGLSRYADEATNPYNREGVEEISIKSPHFMLGQDVSLIDTPGLDAYGYDDHEKLTLEVLLPTVDAVIFVTTCKANSDEKIKDYVYLANDHGKPVIVVQNMIDSIVEKIGPHGQILETKNQVAKKHLRRLQNVLKRANVEAVSLTQVSALWALNGGVKKSRLNALVETIRDNLNRLKPIVMMGRFKQLVRWIDEIIDAERMADDPAALLMRYEQELMDLRVKKGQTEKHYDDLIHSLQEAQRKANVSGKNFCSESKKLEKKSVTEAYGIKNRIKKWLQDSPKELSHLHKKILKQLDEDCNWLNLRTEDMVLAFPKWKTDVSLDLSTKEKCKTYQVEQPGFWGWFKRSIDFFDADWGYDKQHKNWTEIENLSIFKRMIEEAVKQELSHVNWFVDDSKKRTEMLKRQMISELNVKLQSSEEKMSSIADVNTRLTIVEELQNIRSNMEYEFDPVDSIEPNAAKFDERFNQMEFPAAAVTMIRLAKLISRQRFLKVRNDVLSGIEKSQLEAAHRILIAGFDQDCIGDFINRFWFDRLEMNSKPMTHFKAIETKDRAFSIIAVAFFAGHTDPIKHEVRQFMSTPTSLFLLTDIHQIGASANMLMRTGIPLNENNCMPVIVVQSVNELRQADMFAEGLMELKKLIQRTQCKPSDILVNDENTLFTDLARLLLMQEDKLRTFVNETQFLSLLPPRNRNLATATIRSWRGLMEQEEF